MFRIFRRQRADNHEPVPEYRPPIDDGTGDAAAAPERIIGAAAPPSRPLPTRTRHPETGVDE